jgi:hypothetical protein
MSRPTTFPLARFLLAAAVAALFAAVVLGLDGLGPLQSLGGITDDVVAWFAYNTEVLRG